MSVIDSILNAVVVRSRQPILVQKEGFENPASIVGVTTLGYAILVLTLLFLLAFAAGAAKLSFVHSRDVGYSVPAAVVWAILAFFFSNFYYPYYAFFIGCSAAVAGAASINSDSNLGRNNGMFRGNNAQRNMSA